MSRRTWAESGELPSIGQSHLLHAIYTLRNFLEDFEDTKKESGFLQKGQKQHLGHYFSQKLAS